MIAYNFGPVSGLLKDCKEVLYWMEMGKVGSSMSLNISKKEKEGEVKH